MLTGVEGYAVAFEGEGDAQVGEVDIDDLRIEHQLVRQPPCDGGQAVIAAVAGCADAAAVVFRLRE